MSEDARGDFFASGGTKPAKAVDRSAFFSGEWTPPDPAKGHAPDAQVSGDIDSDTDVGAGEAALHGVTGLAGKAVGGIAGIGSLLMGRGNDSAADTAKWFEQALTYDPRTTAGRGATDVGAQALQNPVLNPVGAAIGATGNYAADSAEAAGWSPGAVTAMRMAPEAIAALAGAPGTQAARASVAADVGAGAGAVRRAVTPGESPAAAIAETNPYARESMGAAAATPDLENVSPHLRTAIENTARETGVNREVATRKIEADSLPIKMELSEGQATQHPPTLSNEQNARSNPRWSEFFNRQNQQLIDNLDEIRAEAAPNAVGNDHIQNGQALIDAYKAMDEPIRADITAKYKALEEANGGQFPLNGKDFVSAADAALSKKMKGRYVPAEVAGDLADLRDGGPMTFETFENLRTNLAAEARKADRSGDGNAAAAINIVREALETLPITGEAAKVKPLADAARSAAKARFDRLRSDPAYRAAADDSVPAGELSPLADDFIQKHVVKGKAANIKAMRENLSGDAHAGETIAAGALNYVKSKSGVNLYTNEGNFSQAGYNRALSEILPKIDYLVPSKIAEQAQTLGNVARYTQAQPRGSFVNNSNTFVAAAGEHFANAAEGVANVAAHGVPVGTFARKKLQARSARKSFETATAPEAGLKLKNVLKERK